MKIKTTSYDECNIKIGAYPNGRTAIIVYPLATLTVNIPEGTLAPGEFFVKGWSENEEIIEDARKSGIFIDTGRRWFTGYTEAEVWRFA